MPEVTFKGVQARFNELLLRGYLLALDPWLAAGRGVFGIEFVNRWLLASPSRRATGRVLRRFGAQVATTASVPTHLIIDNAVTGDYRNLRLGHLAYLGKGCFLDLVAPIDIGDEASVSGACVLLTHGDPGTGRFMEQTYFQRVSGPIRIDRYAWIGAGAVVLPGVRIGECSVVGAGAVVTADVEPFTVVAGVPARLIRRLAPTALPEKTSA